MSDQDAAKQIELVEVLTSVLDTQRQTNETLMRLADMLRDVATKALPALHAEQREMANAMQQFHAQMVKLTQLIEAQSAVRH